MSPMFVNDAGSPTKKKDAYDCLAINHYADDDSRKAINFCPDDDGSKSFVDADGSPIKKKGRKAITDRPDNDSSYVAPRPPPFTQAQRNAANTYVVPHPPRSTQVETAEVTTSLAARLPPVSDQMDKKTQIATYMASKLGIGRQPTHGTQRIGNIGPPPLGYENVAVRPAIVKQVTLPRIESVHGLPPPSGGDPHHAKKLKLDKMEQDVCTEDPAAVKISFSTIIKSKEIDSGIVSLETPSCEFRRLPSPTFSTISTISLPLAFSSPTNTLAGSVFSDGSSPSNDSPPAAPVRSYFAIAHSAAALAQIKVGFERAQRSSPAAAAVFVGNLPAFFTDLQLSYEIIEAFKVFGHLNVQVARHYTALAVKPTAILQFTHPVAARKAIVNSRGWRIGGRQLRVGPSDAPRYIIVWRNGTVHPGSMPNFNWSSIIDSGVKQAKQDFAAYGPFDEFEYVIGWWTYMGKPINDGIRIKFTNYGQFLAAKKDLRSGKLPYTEKKAYRGPYPSY